jgi:hypothetical protein
MKEEDEEYPILNEEDDEYPLWEQIFEKEIQGFYDRD